MQDDKYDFTVDWFSPHWPNWVRVTEGKRISKILEIGSFEGRSVCTMIEHFGRAGPLDVFCIDNWTSEFERGAFDMSAAEARFDRNVTRAVAEVSNSATVHKMKGESAGQLAALIASGHGGSFDLVFVDGSHLAREVMTDLVLGFHLCASGGFIICDDYLWSAQPHGRENPLETPRPAIDAFVGLFAHRLQQHGDLPLYQVYLKKTG